MRRVLLIITVSFVNCVAGCGTSHTWLNPSAKDTPSREERREDALRRFEQHRDEAQFAGAMERWQSGDPNTCQAQLTSIVARNPKHLLARRALADLAMERGNVAQAESELRAILEIAPDDAPTQHSLGLLLESLNRTQEARVHLMRAAELVPDNTLYQLCVQNDDNSTPAAQVATSTENR